MPDDDHAPSGLTIKAALDGAHQAGYVDQLIAGVDGRLFNADRTRSVPADEVTVVYLWRIEGASDAADEALVVAVDCPDGSNGTVLLTYGPAASPEDEAILERLDISSAGPGPVADDHSNRP